MGHLKWDRGLFCFSPSAISEAARLSIIQFVKVCILCRRMTTDDKIREFLKSYISLDKTVYSPEVKVEKLMTPCKKGGHDRFLQKCYL